MAKPEWGIKRVCQSCATLFYDFDKSPIVCPSCGAAFDPEAVLKSRRNRVPVPEEAKPARPKAKEDGAENDDDDEDEEEDVLADEDEDEDDEILPEIDDENPPVVLAKDADATEEDESDDDAVAPLVDDEET